MLSRNDKPPSIWDTHGISRNVFANLTASSSAPYPQESNPWVSNVSEHTSPHVMSERQTPDTTLDPRCQSGPSSRSSFDHNEGRFSKNYGADQQRLQISDLLLEQIKRRPMVERRNPLFADPGRAPSSSEIPEWLQEFREILVDDGVPESRDSHASSLHGLSLELARSAALGKNNVYTHFPKDRTCEICQRTKITRARAEDALAKPYLVLKNFGDLITADHKVLSDNCESRNNHRYAVVVQDLATQWIQSYPCKNKTSQETQRS